MHYFLIKQLDFLIKRLKIQVQFKGLLTFCIMIIITSTIIIIIVIYNTMQIHRCHKDKDTHTKFLLTKL